MKPTSTFRTLSLLSRTFCLVLHYISLSTGDETDSGDSSLSSTLSPSQASLNELRSYKMEQEQLHLLSPKKLSLFAKALHKVVQARCPKVDNLELDAFQAYLNRQILKGGVQTLRHPMHCNSLYQNLTGCANFLSSSSAQVGMAPDHYFDDHGDEEKTNKSGSTPPTSTAQTDDGGLLPSSTHSSAVKSSISSKILDSTTTVGRTLKRTSGDNLPLTKQTGSRADPGISLDKNSTNHPPEFATSKNIPKTKTSTVLDKLVYNATDITMKMVEKTGNFLGKLLSGMFERRKRDLSSDMDEAEVGERESTNEKGSPSYSRSPIFLPSELTDRGNNIVKNDDNDPDNNYNEIWKSVSAKETKLTAYAHVIILLKNFILVAVDGCSKTFPFEETYLSKICELMANKVMEDLVEMESEGMMLTVNEKLENDLQLCVDNISVKILNL